MEGSIKQARKGLRPPVKEYPKPTPPPVQQQKTSGAKPKSMTSGKCKGATPWLK